MANVLQNGQKQQYIGKPKAPQQGYITDEQLGSSLKETYYQWLSRLVTLFCVISLMFFASASLVLFRMAPQVMVEPFLIIKQDNSDDMVRYEVIAQDMASSKQMMEIFARWFGGGIVNYMSAPSVFLKFKKETVDNLSEILKEGNVRDVEIISIGKVGGEKSPVWKVDFRTYDLGRGSLNTNGKLVLKTRYWTASVTAFFIPSRMFMGRRLMNPLGFTVTRYSQTEVEIL